MGANPKAQYGDKKRAVALVPPALTLGAAKAFAEGAAKYGPFNWRVNHVENMTYINAIMRHAMAYLDGENVDPESVTGKLHLEGIAACVGILLDSTYHGILIDNRPQPGPAPDLCRMPAAPQPLMAEAAAMAQVEPDETTAAGVADAQEQLAFMLDDTDTAPHRVHCAHLRPLEREDLSRCDDTDCAVCPPKVMG